ncbi:HlyD family efflux transporter periplasmic adaptor subunit [bacterium]|nr:HlyD family efflux transporter periplasmic adaptor subunit [bacterium]
MRLKLGRLVRRIPAVIVGIALFSIIVLLFLLFFMKADITVRVKGTIFPRDYTIVRPEIIGTVKEVYVKENEMVEEGQFLLKLQDAQRIAAVELGEAALNLALAERRQVVKELALRDPREGKVKSPTLARMEMTKKNLELQKKLYEQKAISLKSLKMAEFEYNLAEIAYEYEINMVKILYDQLVSATERVNLAVVQFYSAKRYLLLSEIRSPISSRILTADTQFLLGQYFKIGEPLLRLGNVEKAQVSVEILEEDLDLLEVGQLARVFVRAYPHTDYKVFEGKLVRISPYFTTEEEASKEARRPKEGFTIGIIELEDSWTEVGGETRYLAPGLSAEVDIIVVKKSNILKVLLGKLKKGERAISKTTTRF